MKVTENISTSGQPSNEEIVSISKSKFDAIINLGLGQESYSLNNEYDFITSLGIKYIHIPVEFDDPKFNDYNTFESEMKLLKTKNVFIHCTENHRASVFLALYLMREFDWSMSEASTMINKIWQPNECWNEFFFKISHSELTRN